MKTGQWLLITLLLLPVASCKRSQEAAAPASAATHEPQTTPSPAQDAAPAEQGKLPDTNAVLTGSVPSTNKLCDTSQKPEGEGYACVQKAWHCAKPEGCACGQNICLTGDRCEAGACVCGTEDLRANRGEFLCKDKSWTCVAPNPHAIEHVLSKVLQRRDSIYGGRQGVHALLAAVESPFQCQCAGKLCETGAVCSGGKCLCAGSPSPSAGDYACVDGQWKCDNIMCTCGASTCGNGALCVEGQCLCGQTAQSKDINPEHYYCENGQWICKARSCGCGKSQCARGASCNNDSKCLCGELIAEAKKDLYDTEESYRCENGKLLCGSLNVEEESTQLCCGAEPWDTYLPKTCSCGEGTTVYGTECVDGVGLCAGLPAPGNNYGCYENKWLCMHDDGCTCGEAKCDMGKGCDKGQCIDIPTDYGYPECEEPLGCPCADTLCAIGERCAPDGYCILESYRRGGTDENGYYKVPWSNVYFLPQLQDRCGSEKGVCICGQHTCPKGAFCTNGACSCGFEPAPDDLEDYICAGRSMYPDRFFDSLNKDLEAEYEAAVDTWSGYGWKRRK